MTTETIVATLTAVQGHSIAIIKWLNQNGYIAYPKDLVFKGRLPDNFSIEVFLENKVKVAVLYFNKEGNYVLEGWLDRKHSLKLAEKIYSVFGVKVVLL